MTQITTCRRAEPCGHGQGSDLHYWPQGVAEIGEKIRDVLRERRGDDKVFQFLYQGSFGDNIREQARPLATLLNLATAGSLLATLLVVAMLLIFDRRGARELLVGVYGLRGMIAGYAGALAGVALSHFVVTGLLGWSHPQLTYATALAAVAVPAVYLCGLCALRVAKRKISL